MIWTVPSLHYGIVYSLLDTVPKIGTETYKIYIGRYTCPVSNCDHFLGLTVNDFPLFLTSCKGRPLEAFSGLY